MVPQRTCDFFRYVESCTSPGMERKFYFQEGKTNSFPGKYYTGNGRMDAESGKMRASGCIVFGERNLGPVSGSGPVSVSHGVFVQSRAFLASL